MEICQERLEREFDLDLVQTAPNVPYRVKKFDGEEIEITTPGELPDDGQITLPNPSSVSILWFLPIMWVR